MEKYLIVLSVVGVCLYLFTDLYLDLPKDMPAAAKFEIVQLHHPLMPPSDSDSVIQNKDRALLEASPARTE